MIWYDYYYLILVVPALVISLIAQANVKKAYSSMAKIQNKKIARKAPLTCFRSPPPPPDDQAHLH